MTQTPLKFGRRFILPGGYEYEVTSKHAEWLDVLAARLDDRADLIAALESMLDTPTHSYELFGVVQDARATLARVRS
jgi:hypothetical protein